MTSPVRSITCVVCDDHEALRRGVISLLENEPEITVVGEAADGAEAHALARSLQPDITLLDLHMPSRTGLEICQELTAEGVPTAVILYTGFEDLDDLEGALSAGARGVVLKGNSGAELVRAVRIVAGGQRYVDATVAAGLLERQGDSQRGVLSTRETEVLQLLADGASTQQAGQRLFLSPATIRSYAESAIRKLEADNRVQAVAVALRRRLIS